MMRKSMTRKGVVLAGIAAIVVAAGVGIVLAPRVMGWGASTGGIEVVTAAKTVCPGTLYKPFGHVIGLPAITPRNDCTPSFTVQDVTTFERAHPAGNNRMTPIGTPKLTKVLFITSAEASKRLGNTSIGLPDDALVCVVELYGPYRVYPPMGPVSEHTGTMYEVFDAHTGNLLLG